MKKRNFVTVALLTLFVTIMATSCYVPAFAPFLGKYSHTEGDVKLSFDFKIDGTVITALSIEGYTISNTENYTFDATTITIDGESIPYEMSNFNNTLTLKTKSEDFYDDDDDDYDYDYYDDDDYDDDKMESLSLEREW